MDSTRRVRGITEGGPHVANGRDLRSIHFTYDEGANTSTFFKMFDREPNARLQERVAPENSRPWTMWAPMLALQSPDPGLGLPPGTILQPTIFVRNTTAKTIPARITLNWRGDSGKGRVKLPTLSFAPFATQQIQIGSMQKQLGIPDDAHWALVSLSTPAMPDDLMAMASSYDASGQDNLQTIFSDLLIGHLAGGEWRADAAHDELISITNGGAKATDALLTLHYDNGQKSYEMQQTIRAGGQMWVNVADLIHNRVADRKGSVLPPDLTAGTFDVTDLSSGPGSLTEGSLSLDKTAGSQIIPNTPDCCGDSDPVFDPGSLDVIVNGLEDFGFYAYNQCSDTEVDISASITSWASSNTAIAAVTKRQVQGVSPGSAFAEGYGKVLICEGNREALIPVAPQAPVTVNGIPTSETTSLYNPPTYQITEGSFGMTLNPGIYTYDNHYVEENSPSTGTNSCWWSGANFVQNPVVAGSTWTVAQNHFPHNQYGIDSIGFPSAIVFEIQQQAAQHGIDFPCVVTIYQRMSYEGDANTFYVYANNTLTQTIDANDVQVCRAGVCTGTIPF